MTDVAQSAHLRAEITDACRLIVSQAKGIAIDAAKITDFPEYDLPCIQELKDASTAIGTALKIMKGTGR